MHADVRCQCPVERIGGLPWLTLRPWLVASDPRVREAALRRAAQATSSRRPTGALPLYVVRCLWDRHQDVRSAARGLLWGAGPGDEPVEQLRATRGRAIRTWPILPRERRCLEYPYTSEVADDLIDMMSDASCYVRYRAALQVRAALEPSGNENPRPVHAVLEPLRERLIDTSTTLRRIEPCMDAAREQDALLLRIAGPEVATAAARRLTAGTPRDRAAIPPGPYRDEARQQSDPDSFVRSSALESAHRTGRAWAWEWPPEPSNQATVEQVLETFSQLWHQQADGIPDRSALRNRDRDETHTLLPKDEQKRARLLRHLSVTADGGKALAERFAAVRSIYDDTAKYDYATDTVASSATLALLAEVADSPHLDQWWDAWTALFRFLPVIHDQGGFGIHEVTKSGEMIGLGDRPPMHLPPSGWMMWWDVTDTAVGTLRWGLDVRRDPMWTSAMTRLAVRAEELLSRSTGGALSDEDVALLSRVAAFAPGRPRCLYSPDGTRLSGGPLPI